MDPKSFGSFASVQQFFLEYFQAVVTALLAAGLYRSRNVANFTYEYVSDIIALNLSDIKICVLSAKFFRDLVPLLCVVCINTNL